MSTPEPSPPPTAVLAALEAVIAERRAERPAGSYVVKLLDGGVPKIAEKVMEEAEETVEAAREPGDEGRAHLVRETADLLFHTLVLLGHQGVAFSEVEAELARRFGIGGLVEKASRPPK